MAAVVGSRRTRQLQAALIYLALIALSIAFLFPLIWVLGLSLKTRLQVFATHRCSSGGRPSRTTSACSPARISCAPSSTP
jgi:ABC-type glycerol-3-phosphate transport system permease component